MTRAWVKHFGDDYLVPPVLTSLMKDESEPNDSCPKLELELKSSSTNGIFIITVYVDHPIPKMREMGSRFVVDICHRVEIRDANCDAHLTLLETDELADVLIIVNSVKRANP
jgi:hypothetical protein